MPLSRPARYVVGTAAVLAAGVFGHHSMNLIQRNRLLNREALNALAQAKIDIPPSDTSKYVKAVREYGFTSAEVRSLDSLGMSATRRVPLHRIALTLKGNLSGNFRDSVISEEAKRVYRNMLQHHDLPAERARAARILEVFRNANANIGGGENGNLRSALLKIYARSARR